MNKSILKVGQVVNVRTDIGVYRKAEIQHICNNHATVLFENDPEPDLFHFEYLRPLKTEADKYRESQVENIKQCLSFAGDWIVTPETTAEYLFEVGCRIPAAGERIVKPLNIGQLANLIRQFKISVDEPILVEFIDAVQRELGVIQ